MINTGNTSDDDGFEAWMSYRMLQRYYLMIKVLWVNYLLFTITLFVGGRSSHIEVFLVGSWTCDQVWGWGGECNFLATSQTISTIKAPSWTRISDRINLNWEIWETLYNYFCVKVKWKLLIYSYNCGQKCFIMCFLQKDLIWTHKS